ncbi:hypothetical protein J6590_059055 [Homalodisca vitripennis]|nr:hypothetical protein J6590_059055 [Homalodisca vitripennis]
MPMAKWSKTSDFGSELDALDSAGSNLVSDPNTLYQHHRPCTLSALPLNLKRLRRAFDALDVWAFLIWQYVDEMNTCLECKFLNHLEFYQILKSKNKQQKRSCAVASAVCDRACCFWCVSAEELETVIMGNTYWYRGTCRQVGDRNVCVTLDTTGSGNKSDNYLHARRDESSVNTISASVISNWTVPDTLPYPSLRLREVTTSKISIVIAVIHKTEPVNRQEMAARKKCLSGSLSTGTVNTQLQFGSPLLESTGFQPTQHDITQHNTSHEPAKDFFKYSGLFTVYPFRIVASENVVMTLPPPVLGTLERVDNCFFPALLPHCVALSGEYRCYRNIIYG